MPMNNNTDSDELQMLFDSISSATQEQMQQSSASVPVNIEPPTDTSTGFASDDELQALFDSIYEQHHAQMKTESAKSATFPNDLLDDNVSDMSSFVSSQSDMFHQVGQITRRLHEMLEQLGYEKMLSQTATKIIPDTKQRLEYISTMTEQAAQKVLAATEIASPLVETISFESKSLHERWETAFSEQMPAEEFRQLALDTRTFLVQTQESSDIAKSQLMDIMMAQDFQDLTGQVIKKIIDLAQDLQSQLLVFLIDNIPPEKKEEAETLMNGPVVSPTARDDVVTSQIQVDDLLESLGF